MRLSLQRIFSLILCMFALGGFIGVQGLALFANGSISSGFAPLLYSLILFFCGIILFLSDKTKEKMNFHALLQGDHKKALIFFFLNMLLLIMLFLFGPVISMFIFSVLVGFVLKRQSRKSVVLFSIIFVLCIYFVFISLLKMPFQMGLVEKMIRGF